MKQSIVFSIFLSASFFVPALLSAQTESALTQADFNSALNAIQISNTVSHKVYKHDVIDSELKAFYAANQAKLSDEQKADLFRSLLRNATRIQGTDSFEADYKLFQQLRESPAKQSVRLLVIRDLSGAYYGDKAALFAAEFFFEHEKDSMPPDALINSYPLLAKQSLRFYGDLEKFDKQASALLAVKPADGFDARKTAEFESNRASNFLSMVEALFEFDPERGAALYEARKSMFDDIGTMRISMTYMKSALASQDRELFDIHYAKFLASPDSNRKFGLIYSFLKSGGCGKKEMNCGVINDFLKKNDLPVMWRFRLLETLRGNTMPNSFDYGFYPLGSYENGKKIALQMIALADEDFALEPKKRNIDSRELVNFYSSLANHSFEFGDYPFAEEVLKKAVAINPPAAWQTQVLFSLYRKQDVNASKICSDVLNSTLPRDQKQSASLMKYFIDGGSFEGFDQAFADCKFSSVDKMNAIRSVGSLFFCAKRFDTARKINAEITQKMFKPIEINKNYTVKYLKHSPKTADAWSRSSFYDSWDSMETRFAPYAGYEISQLEDAKHHLKDAPPVTLKDEYRTGLHIVYDETGVHFFLRCNDPKVDEIRLGKRSYGTLEWMFRPGDAHPYHSFFFENAPGTEDTPCVNWAAATKHYRLTNDQIVRDAVLTPEGIAAHVFVPWMMVYDKLPAADNVWRLGLQVWGPDPRSLSGLVHEISRALQLKFEFTPQQMTDLKRNIAITAFNRYNKIRQNKGEFILTWNDPLLGDPDFFQKEIKPLIDELDAAGEKLMAPASDSNIDGFFQKYVPLWAEINYVIADKRTQWLKNKMFTE